jgi:beta-lactamase superfamily II metal-dependent hydrolase
MLKLHVVQAAQGDCLILQACPKRFVLIDGGPEGNAANHLVPTLAELAVRRLDLAIASHVDNDHVLGLLELLKDIPLGAVNVAIAALWHNAFHQTVDAGTLRRVTAIAGDEAVRGYREGGELATLAGDLKIPVNPDFAGGLVTVEDQPEGDPEDDLKLTVVAPDEEALARLRQDWEEWLQEAEQDAARGRRPSLDSSPTNRSSIVVFAECGGRTALLTGDARSDEIERGLVRAGISSDGRLHVNLLKVQHHGSRRSTRPEFFSNVTADKYVVSANGQNPHFESLAWLVDAARARRQKIDLFVTNAPPTVQRLVDERPQADFGYDLRIMKKGEHSHCIDV